MATVGEWLVDQLAERGIDTVYGIPGYHTIELYRGLATGRLRHVTPRHEQGAGFMADGHFRATGRVAAAFVITGPGLTNIATAMAQAKADSVPMLVISAVNRREALGVGAGDLHEVANQGLIGAQCAVFGQTIHDARQIPAALDRAWAVFEAARPGPVHLELPVDLFFETAPGRRPAAPPALEPAVPPAGAIDAAAAHLDRALRPLILAGGGAIGADLAALAERLGAPVVSTTNGRGILPGDHPLSVHASPSLPAVRGLIAASDAVLAVGTEIGRTDCDMYDTGALPDPAWLARIEICPQQMRRGWRPDLGLSGDAAAAVRALLAALGPGRGRVEGPARAAETRAAALADLTPRDRGFLDLLAVIGRTLPGVPVVGDSTQPVYAGNLFHPATAPRLWFNAATGYGALGYGLPAAIGAAVATGGPVVCLAGDGGLQFSIAELGAAVEERLPLILVVWNNRGYGEIRDGMLGAGFQPVGVDLHTPDFAAIGRAYGAAALVLRDHEDLATALAEAAARSGPTVIEMRA